MNFVFNASFFVQMESEKCLLGTNIIIIVFKLDIFAVLTSWGDFSFFYLCHLAVSAASGIHYY